MSAFAAVWDVTGDGGRGLTAVFGMIGFLVLAAGVGVSAYRVSVARRRARESGQSPNAAMLRALSGKDDEPDEPTDPGASER
ncbi:MAG: hypothetical protein WB797_17070 [Nocardioides sp.]